jgi:RNA polymerase sigma-70 factor (ECF subfamily)
MASPPRFSGAAVSATEWLVMDKGREPNDQPVEAPDTALMARIGSGDFEAFAQFFARHSTLLLSIATKVLRDGHEAEEVLQEAAQLIWRNAPVYNASLGQPVSWAVVITRNKAIDRLRALERKSAAIAALAQEAEAEIATRLHQPSGQAWAHKTGDEIRRALAALPPDQKRAIELAFFAGLSQTEVAAELGQPLGTIKARIRRGMLTMRYLLEEDL